MNKGRKKKLFWGTNLLMDMLHRLLEKLLRPTEKVWL